jgi:hypothetical protein
VFDGNEGVGLSLPVGHLVQSTWIQTDVFFLTSVKDHIFTKFSPKDIVLVELLNTESVQSVLRNCLSASGQVRHDQNWVVVPAIKAAQEILEVIRSRAKKRWRTEQLLRLAPKNTALRQL